MESRINSKVGGVLRTPELMAGQAYSLMYTEMRSMEALIMVTVRLIGRGCVQMEWKESRWEELVNTSGQSGCPLAPLCAGWWVVRLQHL